VRSSPAVTRRKERSHMRFIEWSWVFLASQQARSDRWLGSGIGQSTVEYALVGALVVIAAAAAMTTLGTEITGVFNKITATLSGH
jgi:Flp pilus assembly pilin Flp